MKNLFIIPILFLPCVVQAQDYGYHISPNDDISTRLTLKETVKQVWVRGTIGINIDCKLYDQADELVDRDYDSSVKTGHTCLLILPDEHSKQSYLLRIINTDTKLPSTFVVGIEEKDENEDEGDTDLLNKENNDYINDLD